MIRFVKILEYDTKPKDKDTFGYLCAVASQEIDPPTLKPKSLRLDTPVVFHSPLRRAVECLAMREDMRYISISSLKEIPFDMRSMCREEEWLAGKSSLVRRKFKEHFVENQLMMERDDIFEEIRKLLTQLYLFARTSEVSVVSHSFRMKVIEAFIGTMGRIEKEPTLIHEYIHDDRRTFGFGEGFSVSEDDLSF